jgi:hypothetical protein
MNDVSQFRKANVSDTCSLWNLMASKLLYSTAVNAGVTLCCTNFVVYECLHKPGQVRSEREELKRRLRAKLADKSIGSYSIELEDLQSVEVLRSRKKLSIGELSAIVFAQKTSLAVLTDDIGAQKLARLVLAEDTVQNTPHLFGWLYFNSLLNDGDKDQVVADLKSLRRNLSPHLERYHSEAQRCRAIAIQSLNLKG